MKRERKRGIKIYRIARHCEHKQKKVGIERLYWANKITVLTQCFLGNTLTVYGEEHPLRRVRMGGGFYPDTTLRVGGILTSTKFYCTGNQFNPRHLAMVLRNLACISWDYTVLQTYLARCLVIVVCFRIFLLLYPYVVLRTHINISREVCFLFFQKDSTGGRCGGLPEWSSHPAGFIRLKKKKGKKRKKKRKKKYGPD